MAGETKCFFKQLLYYGIDRIISFNNRPLRVCFGLGISLIIASIIYICFVFVQIVTTGIAVPGYFTTISAVLIIGGIQLIFIGVLGEYIGRAYYEVKERPHFIIEDYNINKLYLWILLSCYEKIA